MSNCLIRNNPFQNLGKADSTKIGQNLASEETELDFRTGITTATFQESRKTSDYN